MALVVSGFTLRVRIYVNDNTRIDQKPTSSLTRCFRRGRARTRYSLAYTMYIVFNVSEPEESEVTTTIL